MNSEELRALRAIEQQLTHEDPQLAALLHQSDRWYRRWIRGFAGLLAVMFTLFALIMRDGLLLLTAAGAGLAWVVLGDERTHGAAK
jgi:hypothetical protein